MSKQFSRRDFLRMVGAGLAASGLAGCVPVVATPAPAAQSQSQTEVEAAPPAGEVVHLRKMAWGSPLEKDNIENGLAIFMEENPGIEVEYIHTPDRYMEKLQTMLAAGDEPDVYKVGGSFYADLAVKKALLDITDFVKGDSVLGAADYFFPFEETRSTVDGRWYGIGSTFQWRLLYYNKATLAEAGIEPPSTAPNEAWSWDQFLETAAMLTVDANGNHPGDSAFDVQNVDRWGFFVPDAHYDNYIFSNGGAIIDAATLQYTLDQPQAYEGLQAFADLRLKHRVAAQGAVLEEIGMNAWQMLASGRVAIIQDGNWALQDISKMDFDFGVGVLPILQQPATTVGSSWTGISAKTKSPDPSWKLFRYLNLDEYQAHLVRVGLWGVSHQTLLTPEGVETWWDSAVHPDNWLPLEADYKLKYGHVMPNVVGTLRTEPMIAQALGEIWIGDRTAEEVLVELTPQLNQTLAEEQAKI